MPCWTWPPSSQRRRAARADRGTRLQVLTSNGIAIGSSCEAGICGCCEVAVLDGDVDHRDEVLTTAQRACNKSMMVRCSRAKSERLLLDL